MNIFRVLASGNQTFREEFISAFLAYLLSPKMDHGLGGKVFSSLLIQIGNSLDSPELVDLAEQFEDKLRSNLFSAEEGTVNVELELNTGKGGVIDIVINYEDWFILIENKIYLQSVRPKQVAKQYRGLRNLLQQQKIEKPKILVIYLVPAILGEDGWSVSQITREELDFEQIKGDYCSLVTWQPIDGDVSIVGVLRKLLIEETQGNISPMSYDVRQTLLSFIDFTLGEFGGYPYDKAVSQKASVKKIRVSKILKLDKKVFVGVQYGMAGIMRRAWRNPDFSNHVLAVTEDDNRGWQYIPLQDFQILTKWAMSPESNSLSGIQWSGKPFWTRYLYLVSKAAGNEIYIGIQGGLSALKKMSQEEIEERKVWEIDTFKRSSQWFSGEDYCKVLESKGISYQ